MKAFSSLDLHHFSKELKALENQRIDSFYMVDDIFYLKIYIKGRGTGFLVYKGGKFAYLSKSKPASDNPNGFIMGLRKYLKNAFVIQVEQCGVERILKFTIERKVEETITRYHLYLELFATGNIVFTDGSDRIVLLSSAKKYKDRLVKAGETYQLPPPAGLDYKNLILHELEPAVRSSDMQQGKFLATAVGLGGKFSDELCLRLGLDKGAEAAKLSTEDMERILFAIQKFLAEETIGKLYLKEGELFDFAPFGLKCYEGLEAKDCEWFSDALEAYYGRFLEAKDVREVKLENELRKLENRLRLQEAQKEDVLREYDVLNTKGNSIYEHFTELEDLLKGLLRAKDEKGWEYVEEKVKSDERLKKLIVKIDRKQGKLTLEL